VAVKKDCVGHEVTWQLPHSTPKQRLCIAEWVVVKWIYSAVYQHKPVDGEMVWQHVKKGRVGTGYTHGEKERFANKIFVAPQGAVTTILYPLAIMRPAMGGIEQHLIMIASYRFYVESLVLKQ
jgi:hypothetical protein